MDEIADSADALRRAVSAACRGLVERETLVELVALAAVAGEHLLVLGPPGTAKSVAVRRIARRLGGRSFEYLLGRFTEPSEIFGPIDLRKLRDGVVETETRGMLPEAEIAFLDEVFLGSTAILNTLLGILNERTFRRGQTLVRCPLRVCVAASNRAPDDEALAAFADRFLVRAFLRPVGESRLEELLEGAWSPSDDDEVVASIADLDRLHTAARATDLGPIRGTLAHAIRLLRGAGVELSDRRAARIQGLIAAAAVLDGRTTPTEADLWPIVFAVPSAEGQTLGREVLRELLSPSKSATLQAAAEEGSLGPLARAARILARGRALLEGESDDPKRSLALEAVAREIDASFAATARPAEIAALREQIVGRLGR
jgi:MoxR-like ATPase